MLFGMSSGVRWGIMLWYRPSALFDQNRGTQRSGRDQFHQPQDVRTRLLTRLQELVLSHQPP